MSNETSTWNQLMSAAISMPGVKVNREKFLRKELKSYCTNEKIQIAIKEKPIKVLAPHVIDDLASSCINWHSLKVTGISAATGLGGFATIPADIVQYYWHVFVLCQKLAYLYGYPDLCDEEGNITEASQNMLTLFVGIMMGASAAGEGLKYITEQIVKQSVKRLPEMAIAKTVYYPIIRQVAKWIGVKLTKDTVAKGVGKALPVLGGIISGTLTLVTFKPGAEKLRKSLNDQMYIICEDNNDLSFIDNIK